MHKSNKQTIIIVSIMMGLILCIFLIGSISAKAPTINPFKYTGYIFNHAILNNNYLTMAQIGMIPTTINCNHNLNSYYNTKVILTQQDGSKYSILQYVWGEESCLIKV